MKSVAWRVRVWRSVVVGVLAAGVACVAGVALGGCAGEREVVEEASAERLEFSRVCMGVRARVVVYAPVGRRGEAEGAVERAFARMAEVEAAISDYRPASEFSRLSAGAGGAAQRVGRDTARVLHVSAEVSAATGGAFDVTVGPLVGVWRAARRSGGVIDAGKAAEARGLVGWRGVEVGPVGEGASADEGAMVRLARAGMRLDAGGVGKGYAAAEGLVVLREAGFGAALVGLAGDIAVGLPPPGREGGVGVGGGGWLVAISTDAGEPTGRVLELREASVSTSGAAVQVARAGEWGGPEGAFGRGHVVDPRSGVWLSPGGAMTVVVRWGADPARAGALADALATAALVLGEEGARRAVGGFAGAELVVTPGREGRWRE